MGAGPLSSCHEEGRAVKIGIVMALKEEARTLLPGKALRSNLTIHLGETLALRICGMGPASAEKAACILLSEGALGLVSYGLAGGLLPGLAPGTLLLPKGVLFLEKTHFTDVAWRARILQRLVPQMNPVEELLLTLMKPVSSVQDKAHLHRETGAVAVDMESGAVLAAAATAGVPGLVLRSVVDPAEMSLPRAVLGRVDRQGQPRLSAVIQSLLLHPWEVTELFRLRIHFISAVESLRQAWLHLGPEGLMP